MNNFFDSLISSRNRRIIKRDELVQSPLRGILKQKQRKAGSLSFQKKSPKRTLIKINKKRFPKDFFPPTPSISNSPLSPVNFDRTQPFQNERKESYQQTLDTPNPSFSLINSEENTIFNKTSFFGTQQLMTQTIQLKEQIRYFSNEKHSISRGKPAGKLTAVPSMHKSTSYRNVPDDLYNCTFSRDFSAGLQSVRKSKDWQREKEKERGKEESKSRSKQKEKKNGKEKEVYQRSVNKWSQVINMEFFPEGEVMTTNQQVGNNNFRMRKKMLISNRPASLLPKIEV